jgi:hypothetical protein
MADVAGLATLRIYVRAWAAMESNAVVQNRCDPVSSPGHRIPARCLRPRSKAAVLMSGFQRAGIPQIRACKIETKFYNAKNDTATR